MKKGLLLAAVVSVLGFLTLGPPAQAQPTTMLEEFQFGENSLVARLLFLEGEEGELCVAVGTRRGPRSLNRNSIYMTRRVRPKEKGYSGRLKFKFKNKPDDDSHESLQIWHACVPSAGRAPEGAKEDVIEVTVRGGQENGLHSRFYADYPPEGKGYAVDIHFNNVGGLAGGSYEMPLDPENPRSLAWQPGTGTAREELPPGDAGEVLSPTDLEEGS